MRVRIKTAYGQAAPFRLPRFTCTRGTLVHSLSQMFARHEARPIDCLSPSKDIPPLIHVIDALTECQLHLSAKMLRGLLPPVINQLQGTGVIITALVKPRTQEKCPKIERNRNLPKIDSQWNPSVQIGVFPVEVPDQDPIWSGSAFWLPHLLHIRRAYVYLWAIGAFPSSYFRPT